MCGRVARVPGQGLSIYLSICIHVYIHIYIHVQLHVYIYIYIYMYVCVCIYIYVAVLLRPGGDVYVVGGICSVCGFLMASGGLAGHPEALEVLGVSDFGLY